MKKQLKKIGNSIGFIIEAPILKLLNFKEEITVEVTSDGKGLIIRPAVERTNLQDEIKRVNQLHARTFEELAK